MKRLVLIGAMMVSGCADGDGARLCLTGDRLSLHVQVDGWSRKCPWGMTGTKYQYQGTSGSVCASLDQSTCYVVEGD